VVCLHQYRPRVRLHLHRACKSASRRPAQPKPSNEAVNGRCLTTVSPFHHSEHERASMNKFKFPLSTTNSEPDASNARRWDFADGDTVLVEWDDPANLTRARAVGALVCQETIHASRALCRFHLRLP
jgi:hypothetical protein